MTLAEIQREIASLPSLEVPEDLETPDASAKGISQGVAHGPLEIVARQGRLILRLTAAVEAQEARQKEIAARLAERNAEGEAQTNARREAERRSRQLAQEMIHILDALDWVQTTLGAREDSLAGDVARARNDCLRRLAAVGVTEIPTDGMPDGRLHESVGTEEAPHVPQYHVVSVVRRGYQWDGEVLRRAEVVTAS